MGTVKKLLKKVPGVTLAANKTRTLIESYEYRKALARIKATKEIIIKRHANNPDRKIVVAFIIQYIPSWNKLKPIYDRLSSDNDFVTLLLCVPSLFNENRVVDTQVSENTNDTFEYFKNQGYDCINAFDGKTWFDLKKSEPDYVFHSRPYNQTMPKQYTSSKISKYALICNIMYATTLVIDVQNMLLNRDFFKDVFCYFAFNREEEKLFKKRFHKGIQKGTQTCYPFGTTVLEQMLLSKSIKGSRSFKKTVLWTPRWSTDSKIGGSNFFRYKNLIQELIAKYDDVMFIIRPHPLMFGNFVSTGEMTKKEVIDFKNYCKKKKNVQLDEKKEYNDTFWHSDILITDASSIVLEYYVTSKPIIYCTSNVDFTYPLYAQKVLANSYIVDNTSELVKAFEQLYNDNDYKQEKRKDSVMEIFGDIENSSANIVSTLRQAVKTRI